MQSDKRCLKCGERDIVRLSNSVWPCDKCADGADVSLSEEWWIESLVDQGKAMAGEQKERCE